MTDVEIPAANMVGTEGEGFKIAMFCLDQGRYTVASGSTGLIKACRDASVKYAHERETFRQPIAQHQLVKQMIAKMEAGYEYSRLLWLKAGWKKNMGEPNTRETSLCKWIACQEAESAASDAVQVHGAYGFSDEYPVERFYRNAKGSSIYEGTREIHTLIQADYALGFRKDKPLRTHLPIVEQE
jgi:glutaryl-CoA dehydrogenase (non-decarboxylating)